MLILVDNFSISLITGLIIGKDLTGIHFPSDHFTGLDDLFKLTR